MTGTPLSCPAGRANRAELPPGNEPRPWNHCQPFPHSLPTSQGASGTALQPPPRSPLPAAPPSPPQGPTRPRTTTQLPAPSAPRGTHARKDPQAGLGLRPSPEPLGPLSIPARRQRGRRCATSRQRRQRRRRRRAGTGDWGGKGVRAGTAAPWPRPRRDHTPGSHARSDWVGLIGAWPGRGLGPGSAPSPARSSPRTTPG